MFFLIGVTGCGKLTFICPMCFDIGRVIIGVPPVSLVFFKGWKAMILIIYVGESLYLCEIGIMYPFLNTFHESSAQQVLKGTPYIQFWKDFGHF